MLMYHDQDHHQEILEHPLSWTNHPGRLCIGPKAVRQAEAHLGKHLHKRQATQVQVTPRCLTFPTAE